MEEVIGYGMIIGIVWLVVWAMTCPKSKPVQRTYVQPLVPVCPPTIEVVTEHIQEECIWTIMRRDADKRRAERKLVAGKPKWFICDWVKDLKISPAEQLIIDQLSRYKIQWAREVSFEGLLSDKGAPLRYDFYLPQHNTIIEYQGAMWHKDPLRIEADKTKAQFCRNHNITLIVWSGEHYYHIEYHVRLLMNKLNVKVIPR